MMPWDIVVLHVYHKWQSYDLWFLKNEAQQAEFSVILGHIPPYPTNNPKNQNFKKWKNPWWYHHFTQVYQDSGSFAIPFTRYGACLQLLFSIWGYFLPFYAPNSPKNLNLTKKKKKCLEISFYTSATKTMTICYTVREIWHVTFVIVIFHFGIFFSLLPKNSPKYQNEKKNLKKKLLEISSFYTCTKNYDQMMPDIWCATDGWTDGWTDGQKDGQTDGRTE